MSPPRAAPAGRHCGVPPGAALVDASPPAGWPNGLCASDGALVGSDAPGCAGCAVALIGVVGGSAEALGAGVGAAWVGCTCGGCVSAGIVPTAGMTCPGSCGHASGGAAARMMSA